MSKLNSPLFLFLAAKEYFENGTLYASKYFRRRNNELISSFDSQIHVKLCVPATNISFALELAFKGLLQFDQNEKRGHDLINLYQCLRKEVREKILDHYKNHDEYKNYIGVRLVQGDGKNHGGIYGEFTILKEEQDIQNLLEQHRVSFVNFRYLHEFKNGEEWHFDFKQFSNFTYSTIVILGASLGHEVKILKTKQQS